MTSQTTISDDQGDNEVATLKSRAQSLVQQLSGHVSERDTVGGAPHEEAAALKASGLLTLTIPKSLGGEGANLSSALKIVRYLARVDPSAATLFGYHHMHLARIRLQASPSQWEQLASDTVSQGLLWGGAGNPRDEPVALKAIDGGYAATGRKTFATGAQIGDRILFNARLPDGQAVLVYVEQDEETVHHADDWQGIGLRRSASGSVDFIGALVPEAAVLAEIPSSPATLGAYQALSEPAFQLLFSALYIGIAEGALAHAAAYTRTRSRPALGSVASSATNDPYILETYGSAVAANAAAASLWNDAAAHFDALVAAGEKIERLRRDAVNGLISAVKHLADQAVLNATTKAFELTGARAAVNGSDFERFWRDARVHTLHDAAAYRRADAGSQYLIEQNLELFQP